MRGPGRGPGRGRHCHRDSSILPGQGPGIPDFPGPVALLPCQVRFHSQPECQFNSHDSLKFNLFKLWMPVRVGSLLPGWARVQVAGAGSEQSVPAR